MTEKNGQWDISFTATPGLNDWNTVLGYIDFNTAGYPFRINMDGKSTRSWDSFLDGNWHHFVFSYDATNNIKKVIIDGKDASIANGMAQTVSGNITTSGIYFSDSFKYRKFEGGMDEIAIYKSAIPGNLALQMYQDFQSGNPYSSTTNILSTNVPDNTLDPLDPMDYPKGMDISTPALITNISVASPAVITTATPHGLYAGQPVSFSSTGNLPTGISAYSTYYVSSPTSTTFKINNESAQPVNTTSAGSGVFSFIYLTPPTADTPIQQLRGMQVPRFKPGSGITPSINWMDPAYFGRTGANSTASSISQNAKLVALELAQSFKSTLSVGWDNGPGASYSPGTLHGELAASANAHPELPTSLVIYRNSVTTAGNQPAHLLRQNLASDHYLQNSSGTHTYYINGCGQVNGVWRPSMAWNEYAVDGDAKLSGLVPLLNQLSGRAAQNPGHVIDYFSENQELIPYYFESNCLGQDPQVAAGTSAAGYGTDYYKYTSFKIGENYRKAYRDRIFSDSRLANSKFDMYQTAAWYNTQLVDYGHYSWDWTVTRDVITPAANGHVLQSMDFYSQNLGAINRWQSADHGLRTFEDMLSGGMASGDKYMRAFTSPGWSMSSIKNMPMPLWLGALKALTFLGVESFNYANFNNIKGYTMDPSTYIGEAAVAQYAQGVTTRYMDFYNNSTTMPGDLPAKVEVESNGQPNLKTSFRYATGNPTDIIYVRKADSGAKKYAIGGFILPTSIQNGTVAKSRNAKITLDGATVQFENRRQGSGYIYDNTNPAAPVFYQLDGWHESTNPAWWSSDFSAEAENYDTATSTPTLYTEGPGVSTRNFTPGNYDTYMKPASGTMTYIFQARNSNTPGSVNRYGYIRARSLNGSAASAQLQVDTGTTKSISVSSGTFCWIKTDTSTAPLAWSGITENTDHNFKFIASSANFAFDKFILSSNASLNTGTLCTGGTNTPPSVSITAPTNNYTATVGTTIPMTATATDTDGTVSSVQYSWKIGAGNPTNIGGPVATSPYSVNWTTTGLSAGTYTLNATATDNSGSSTTSSGITVTLTAVTPPSVIITAPTTGTTYTSTTSTLSTLAGTATAGTGSVTSVTWANTTNTTSGTATGTTSWTVPSISLVAGVNIINVTVTNSGGATSSDSLSVTYTAPDTTGPTLNMTAPTNGATLSGNATVSATSTDLSGVSYVMFKYQMTGGAVNSMPGTVTQSGNTYTISWNTNTTNSPNGTYTVWAVSADTLGNTTTSSTISVTINNIVIPPADTTKPIVSIVDPIDNSNVSGVVNISATASDPAPNATGVANVKFYYKLASSSAYTLLDTSTGANGTYSTNTFNTVALGLTNGAQYNIKAVAIDSATPTPNSSLDSIITVTVNNANLKPDVVVTDISWTPASAVLGAPLVLSATITNQGSAPTPAGTITGVSFWINNGITAIGCNDGYTASIPVNGSVTLTVGANGSSSYCNGGTLPTTYAPTATGPLGVMAYVDDINRYAELNENNNQYTEVVSVTASSVDTTPPVVTLVSPVNGQNVAKGSTVPMSVNTTDNVGVVKVEYYRNGTLQCTKNAPSGGPSFTCNWNIWLLSATGNVTMYAKAYDAAGNVGTSPTIVVHRQ
jgi:hypothetical protein